MAINFIKKEDLSHITRTTRQWETTIDRYEIIPKGVLCIELCNDKLTKIKIGNGHLIYEQLPYVSDVNLSDYYTKEETNTLLKNLKSIKIKGEASSLSDLPLSGNEDGDLWFVAKPDPNTHSRYDEYIWYNNEWESFGSSDIDLSEYAKKSYVDTHIQEVQDEITEIIESGYLHKHSNKDILDQTSAVYTVEKDNKLRDLHNYDDTELREKAHTHLNKNILDQTDAVYNRDKDDKLIDLHNYDDTDVKNRIYTLESIAHSHANQDIIDRITAAFTREQAITLLDCKDFEGTDGVHDGYHGFVPAPTKDDVGKVLGANGQWVDGGSGGGDTIVQGGGIEITTDQQTNVKTVSVNAGTGLDIDSQTGELYVTATGGDTIAEGDGINITTDTQTDVKTISVATGNGLLIDEDGQIAFDDSILPETPPTYNAGVAISFNERKEGGVVFDAWDSGTGWENVCYQSSTGNAVIVYTYEAHSPISNSYVIPASATKIKAVALDTNNTSLWTSYSWIDANDYHFESTAPEEDHYNDWFVIPEGAVKVNFGVRHSKLDTSQPMNLNDIKSVTITCQTESSEVDVWNGGTGWSNGAYRSNSGNAFINWAAEYHSPVGQNSMEIPEGATKLKVDAYSTTDQLLNVNVHWLDSSYDRFGYAEGSPAYNDWIDIAENAVYTNFGVRWSSGSGTSITGDDIKSVIVTWNTPSGIIEKIIDINVNYGNGLTVNQDNELEVNVGDGLSVNASNEVELDKATTTTIGGVIVGDNLSIDDTGTLSADEYTPGEGVSIDANKEVSIKYNSDGLSINASDELELDKATNNSIGGVIIGDNIDVTDGTISVPNATDSSLGVVKPTDGLSIDNTGELSVNTGNGLSINQDNELEINAGDGLIVDANNELEVVLGTGLEFDPNVTETMTADEMYLFESRVECQVHTDNPYSGRPTDRVHQKTTTEPALCCLWEVSDSGYLWTGPLFVGLTPTSVQYTTQDTQQTVDYQNTFTYLDKTWYTSGYPDFLNDADHEDKLGNLQYLGSYAAVSYQIQAAKDLIDLANVQFISNAGIQVKLGHGLTFDENGAIEVTGGGDIIAEGDGITITTDSQTGIKTIGVNAGNGLEIDPNTGELTVDESILPDAVNFEPGDGIVFKDLTARTLPTGYTQVEYIESHFTAGFIMDYYPKKTSKIVTEVAYIELNRSNPSDNCLFGSRNGNSSSSKQFVFWFNHKTSDPTYIGFVYSGDGWSDVGSHATGLQLYEKALFEISAYDGVLLNGTRIQNAVSHPDNDPSPYKLGFLCLATSDSGIDTSRDYQSGRVYSFKIYEDDGTDPVVDLVPCLNSSNVAGMYDVANDVFYPSTSGTDFTCTGAVVIDSTKTIINANPGKGIKINTADNTIETDTSEIVSSTGGLNSNANNEIEINIGTGLSIDENNILNVNKAETSTLGGIKVGTGFIYDSDGTLNAEPSMPPFEIGDGLELAYDSEDILPSEYGRIDYVWSNPESTTETSGSTSYGRAYTITDYIPTNATRIIATFENCSYQEDSCIIGSRYSGSNQEFELWFAPVSSSKTEVAFIYGGTGYDSGKVNYSYNLGTPVTLEGYIENGSVNLKINDTLIKTYSYSGNISPYKLGIFRSNKQDKSWEYDPTNAKIYSIKIYEGDTLAVNLIPALRLVDDVVGFYDNISDKFYTSITSYPFITDMSSLVPKKLNVVPATANTIGGIKVGNGLSIDNTGELSVNTGNGLSINQDNQLEIQVASTDNLGGIKVGTGLSMDADGYLSATTYTAGLGVFFLNDDADDSFIARNKEYYFDDMVSCQISGNYGPRTFTRLSDEPCLMALMKHNTSWCMPIIVGLTAESVDLSQSYDGTILHSRGTLDYKGYTWYVNANYGLTNGSMVDLMGNLQTLPDMYTIDETLDSLMEVARDLIDVAGVIDPVKSEDVWNNGTGWLNGAYNDSSSDQFWTNWYYTYHSNQNEYFEVPTGATKMRLIGISNENDSRLQGGGVDCFDVSHHHFASVGCITDEWFDIPEGTIYVQFGVKWNELNDRTISSSDIKSVTFQMKLPISTDNSINVGIGDGLTYDANNQVAVNTGNGLSINQNNQLELQIASTDNLGGIKVGDGLSIESDGTLSADGGSSYTAGEGISITTDQQTENKVISVNTGDGITIDSNNNLTLDTSVQLIIHCVPDSES